MGRVLAAMISGALAAGCVAVSTLQTAETVEPGDLDFYVGVGYVSLSHWYWEPGASRDSVLRETTVGLPATMGVGWRYGIGKRTDVGVMAIFPPLAVDVKRQMLDQREGAPLSLALDLGALLLADFEKYSLAPYPAVIASRTLGGFQPYLALKALWLPDTLRFGDVILGRGFYPGLGFGARFGGRWWFAPELNLHWLGRGRVYQVGIGLGGRIKG